MKEILIAVVTSLIASVIFWFVFNYIPEKRRYNKVRPKVEFDVYEIFIKLSSYLGIGLEINEYGWSFPRDKIESGQVTKEDFNLWLQNKCLNSSYQFDEMGSKMLAVGDSLERCSRDICDKIEKCATYYSFMTADEILLLRKISAKVTTYSYIGSAEDKVGGTTLRPVVPNIAYMAENFAEISKLYIDLQQIVWSYKKIDRSINKYIVADFSFNEATRCYIRGEFKRCIKYIKKSRYASVENKRILLFKAYYNLGNKSKAMAILKLYMENSTHKTSLLYSLLDDEHIDFYDMNEWVGEVLSSYISEIELYEAIEESIRSQSIQKQGIETAEEIKEFYKQKLDENSRQAKQRVAQKQEKIAEQLEELRNQGVLDN